MGSEALAPSLYQVNARVWLTERSRILGRTATLDDIPDAEPDRVAEMGFDWIWLLRVWRTGLIAQRISRQSPEWRREFEETLPNLRGEDIAGSGFAITGYTVHLTLGAPGHRRHDAGRRHRHPPRSPAPVKNSFCVSLLNLPFRLHR
jgi:hypothetical protein